MVVLTLIIWNWFANMISGLSLDVHKVELANLNNGDLSIRGLI